MDVIEAGVRNGFSKQNSFKIIKPAIDLEVFANTNKKRKKLDNIKFLTVARLHWKKDWRIQFRHCL